jgi:probable HAF family extracellular repeat protein
MVRSLSFVIAFLCVGGSFSVAAPAYTLINLGGSGTYGYAINALGEVTGRSTYSHQAHAFLYDGAMHDLGTLGNFASGSAINASGQVVGLSYVAENVIHAFHYDGAMHDLGTLGGTNAYAYGINDSGVIVGLSNFAAQNPATHAYRYDGTMHDLGTLGGTNSSAMAINNNGWITGSANIAGDLESHAYIYDGVMHDIGLLPGGKQSQGRAININGLVVGSAEVAENINHAFLYDGVMHDLGTLGGSTSLALGINASGQVVGMSDTTGNASLHAFLWDNGQMFDLNDLIPPTPGVRLIDATGINDAGQIVVHGSYNFFDATFLLTPVPEPATILLAAFGSSVLLASRCRRRLKIG